MAIDLDRQLQKILDEYTDEAIEGMSEAAKEVANRAATTLKSAGPARTGQYNSGWKVKEMGKTLMGVSYVIHNPKRYRLTHLLEHGHVNRDGSRTAARVHIKPVEEQAIKAFEEAVISKL